MTKAITLFCCLFISNLLSAQNTINGTVYDENQKPIYYANVAIYQLPDSVLVDGNVTDDTGKFTIDKVKDGNYYLEASMIGFVDAMSDIITVSGGDNPDIDLQLLPDATILSEIEIKARKPLLEQRADRMIVNVSENLASTNGSLLDVMRKVPGMLVVNDKLSLAGQQNVTILINGKSTKYMDVQSLLRDLPGDNIKSVEIIHQPGAEFEASGTGPIINIVTKKNNLFGTNGTISAGVGHTNAIKYNTGLQLSHYQGAFNLQGSVGYSHNRWQEELIINRYVNNGTPPDQYQQETIDPSKSNTIRAGFIVDWDVSDRHRLGLNTRAVDSNKDYVSTNKTVITSQGNVGRIDTENSRMGGWDMYVMNPYYSWAIDTSGQKLELDANWVDFDITRLNILDNTSESFIDEPDRKNDQLGDNKIFTTKVDYTLPINSSITVKAGGRYSDADLDNDLKVSDADANGDFVLNDLQSNRFQFREKVKAVYSKAEYKFGDITGTIGLRYENSKSEGYSVTIDSLLTRSISKLFPSASITKPINGSLAANLAYSYRIDRPRYSTLNPFRYYYDPFTSERGNPSVRPELTHSLKFSLSFDGQPFFNVAYKKTKDSMFEVTEQNDDTGEIYRQYINLDNYNNFNVSLFLPYEMFSPLGGYVGGILNYNDYDSEYLDGQFTQSAWSFTAYSNISYTFPWDLNSELVVWYQGGGQEGIIQSEWLYGTSFSLSKKLLNKKLRLSLGIEDFLNRFWNGSLIYENIDATVESRWSKNVVNFRASYSFGNQHIKNKKKSASSANDVIRRVDTN